MSERDDASYIEHLEAKVAELESQIAQLQQEIGRVKKEKGLSSVRDGLTFSDHLGIWADETGRHYCPRCLDQDKRNPLKTEERGWRCTVCGHYYGDPDKPFTVVRTRRGGSRF